MADTGIFATTAEVQRKVGTNVSGTSNVEAYINQYISEAESEINVFTRYNWSDAYSGLNADVKGVLKMIASNLAAIMVINYDTDAIQSASSLIAAENRITVLRDAALRGMEILRDKKPQDFMNNA